MFYTYGLTAENAGANQYSKSVGAASSQKAFSVERTAAIQLILPPALTPQFVGYGAYNPFSSDFSSDFGAGSGTGNYILLTVNAIRGAVDAEIAALLKQKSVPTATSPLPAQSSQSASLSSQYLAVWLARTASASLSSLQFPRINHEILAAKSASAVRVLRGFFKALSVVTGPASSFTNEFTNEFGPGSGANQVALVLTIGHKFGVTSPSAEASGLRRRISKVGLSAHDASVVSLLGPGSLAENHECGVGGAHISAGQGG